MKKIGYILVLFAASITHAADGPYKTIELTKREKTALSAVANRNSTIDETAFWMLCGKIAKNPKSMPSRDQTEFGIYHYLINNPKDFRAKAINLRVSVFAIEKLIAGETPGWPVRKYWPAESTMWRISCLINNSDNFQKDKPLIIYSVIEPKKLLTQKSTPDKKNPNQKIFSKEAQYIITGVFYKTISLPDKEDKMRLYPVIIAYSLKRLDSPIKNFSQKQFSIIILAAVVLLAFCFYLIRKQTGRLRSDKIIINSPSPENEEEFENIEVDKNLIDAVKDYKEDKLK